MKPLTSIFDFYERAKTDKRYEALLIVAYEQSGFVRKLGSYEKAVEWMESWIAHNKDDNCKRMVNYLNDCITRIPKSQLENLPAEKKVVTATPIVVQTV